MRTALSDRFGIEHAIVQAPMAGGWTTPALAAAASEAGGLGTLADPAVLARIPKRLPVLLVAGDADPLNRKLEGLHLLERRWRDAGVQRIDSRYYAGGRHEMLNEINRDEVTRDVIDWLAAVMR